MENKILNTDADGVCLDFTSGFYQFMLKEFNHKNEVDEPFCFGYSDAFPGVKNRLDLVRDFVQSRDYFSQIKAYPDAINSLENIKKSGAFIRIVTSCGKSKETKDAREECISRELTGIIDDLIFVDYGSCKSDIINSLPPSIFVDDLFETCKKINIKKHKSFLFSRNYNLSINTENSGILRIKSLSELLLNT